jgi:hypothetical protein
MNFQLNLNSGSPPSIPVLFSQLGRALIPTALHTMDPIEIACIFFLCG